MKTFSFFLAVVTLTAHQALTQEPEEVKKRLRLQARLPVITTSAGIGFNSTFGSYLTSDKLSVAGRISELEKEMTGDAADAERYCRLGDLYHRAKDPLKAKNAYDKAINLCRKQLKGHPGEVRWRITLAEALWGKRDEKAAEKLLHQALKDAPDYWRGWLILASLLEGQAYEPILGKKMLHWSQSGDMGKWRPQSLPPADKVQEWQRRYQEVQKCYNRAVALHPRTAEPYKRWFFARVIRDSVQSWLKNPCCPLFAGSSPRGS